MMRKIVALLVIVSFCASLSGCATVMCGTSQNIPVSSNPTGAVLQVDGSGSFTTPTTLRLERKRDHVLVFTKEGYDQQNVTILHVISGAVCGNILLGGLIGWGVDAMTGAQFKLVPENVNVELKKSSGDSAAKAAAPVAEMTPEQKISQLQSMYEKKMITQEEFEANKKVILYQMSQGEKKQ